MRIYVIGTRGFPGVQGGVEQHCYSLYTLVTNRSARWQDINIKVFRRKPYIKRTFQVSSEKSQLHFCDLWCPKNKYLETIFHSFFAAILCVVERPDLVHIHNVGPSLVLPLLRLGGLKAIVTYHSANYNHKKWGHFARQVLLLGEFFVKHLAEATIFVSREKYREISCLNKYYIPNGVTAIKRSISSDYLSSMQIKPRQYVLAVGRFSQEKGLHLLMKAFIGLKNNYQLVIAGSADYETAYSRYLREIAESDNRIILTGHITGEDLVQVYSNARLFCLPSYHEGLPMALLEAMNYGIPVLVSDIPANKEVVFVSDRFFCCGNIKELRRKIKLFMQQEVINGEQKKIQLQIRRKYDWLKVAEQTIKVYEKSIKRPL